MDRLFHVDVSMNTKTIKVIKAHWQDIYVSGRINPCYVILTTQGFFLGNAPTKREAVIDAVRGINEWKENVK